jgi:hypothetical protein
MDTLDNNNTLDNTSTNLQINKASSNNNKRRKLIIEEDNEKQTSKLQSKLLAQCELNKVANYLKENVNWKAFVNLVKSVGNQFNDAQWRFFKAVVFETSIQKFSNGKLQYVAKEGCDFIIPELKNIRLEMKYVEDALYTAKGHTLREYTKTLTLLNSKGTNSHKELPPDYADYLLVVGQIGGALIDKTTLSEYITINGDSISASIPTGQMILLFTPDTINVNVEKKIEVNLRRTILNAIENALSYFM